MPDPGARTSVRRRFARDAALLSAQAVVQRLLGMVTSIILARGLGAAGLGVLNAIQATADNAYGLGRLGLDVATHVHLAEADAEPARKGRIVAAAALAMSASALVSAAACWLGAGWLARILFDDPDLAGWLRLASLLVLGQFALKFCYAAMAGLHAFGRYAFVTMAMAVASLLATAAGVLVAGLAGAVTATIVVALGGAIWLAVEVGRGLRAAGIPASSAGLGISLRALFRLGGPFYLTGLFLIPVAYGLQGLLARTGGIEEMGYLRVMLSLAALVSFLPASIIGPTVSSLAVLRTDADQDPTAFARHAVLNIRLVWLYCLIAVLAIAVVLVPLVRLLFGEAFVSAIPAYRWGLVGAMLIAVEGVVTQVFLAGRRVWSLFALLSARALLFAGLGAALIPAHAIRGYLAADAISLGLLVPVGLVVFLAAERAVPVKGAMIRLGALAALSVVAASALLPGWSTVTRPWLALAALLFTAGVGYALVLEDDERRALRALPARLLGTEPGHGRES